MGLGATGEVELHQVHGVAGLQHASLPKRTGVKIGRFDPNFQHDNASIHASRLTKDFLAAHNIEMLPCPAKRPDLNIIEKVWRLLAHRVYANGRQFDKPTDLIEQIKLEWSRIDPEYVRKLVTSVPKRLEATRLFIGANTGYWSRSHLGSPSAAIILTRPQNRFCLSALRLLRIFLLRLMNKFSNA
ncbi:unnamed protein product [Phytophthora fragariaefolia]|uniref:Unnamed protein product n=1 Tax=Phytophthora fragariaefolia TaxID=1490495 RepID=A0A9W6YA56_9STRA|nr:unnamed protein product [Phytophthora fragariaefolia]